MFSVVVGDDSDNSNEDEEGEDEPENAHESLTDAVEGGEEEDEKKEAGFEEFIDKEHESQFCLETNFMDKGEQENSENAADSKGKILFRSKFI